MADTLLPVIGVFHLFFDYILCVLVLFSFPFDVFL